MFSLLFFRRGLRIIGSAFKPECTYLTFQTKWQADQLLELTKDGNVYSGGLLTDVTYKFFANGYLMTTSKYSDVLTRWVPIQFTWLFGLNEEHHEAHFTALMIQLKEAHITSEERELLVRQVVDFSAAQKMDLYLRT